MLAELAAATGVRLTVEGSPPGGQRESASPAVWLACWAHMSLRIVDWAIREWTADDVSAWLRVAAEVRAENDSVPPYQG